MDDKNNHDENDDDNEDEDWKEENNEEYANCLFCSVVAKDPETILNHMRDFHDRFDINSHYRNNPNCKTFKLNFLHCP